MARIEINGTTFTITADSADEVEYIQVIKCPHCPAKSRCGEMPVSGTVKGESQKPEEIKRDASCV